MNIQESFDKMINLLPLIQNEDVPYIDQSDFKCRFTMEEIDALHEKHLNSHPDRIVCKPYIIAEKNPYVEVYFIGTYGKTTNDKDGVMRFVFAPGRRLPFEDEKNLIFICSSEALSISLADFIYFYRGLEEFFSINMPHDSVYKKVDQIGQALLRVYFTFSRTYTLELLYKANLDIIASNLTFINQDIINYRGKSPSDIFSGVKIKLLRALNQEKMVYLMFKREDFEEAVAIYNHYSYMFPERITNAQYRYLQHLYKKRLTFNRKIFNQLAKETSAKIADGYALLNELEQEEPKLFEYYPVDKVPDAKKVLMLVESILILRTAIKNEEWFNSILAKRTASYGYCDIGNVFVTPLTTIFEFAQESYHQKNCLLYGGYLWEEIRAHCVILGLRKKENPTQPYITIEVRNQKIETALLKYNRPLNDEEVRYVVKYAKKLGITYTKTK